MLERPGWFRRTWRTVRGRCPWCALELVPGADLGIRTPPQIAAMACPRGHYLHYSDARTGGHAVLQDEGRVVGAARPRLVRED